MWTESKLRLIGLKKSLIPLRFLISPYKNWKLKQRYQEYLKSGNVERIRQLKDSHIGERCFILGNGPSLKHWDLDMLKGEFTFASNRIYNAFEDTLWLPDVYMAVDPVMLETELIQACAVPCKIRVLCWNVLRSLKRESLDRKAYEIWRGPKKFKICEAPCWADKSAHIPDDVAYGFSNGQTVTFDAIQLAIYMGFSQIYLLGVDFNYTRVLGEDGHFHSVQGVQDHFGEQNNPATFMVECPILHAYTAARQYCDAHGIRIRNATRGGKLEVFERVQFEDLFETD